MGAYVERDGDWVWRAPGNLEQVHMIVLALRANTAKIQALCDTFINVPSGRAVTAAPLFPKVPFVLLVCANIRHGYSAHPSDIAKGYMTERDVGIFVPISFTDAAGATSTAMLLPYLFVDNMPAVVIGREIFGFPKILANIEILADPPFADVISKVLPVFGPDRCVVERPVIQMRTTGPGGETVCVGSSIPQLTIQAVNSVLQSLGIPGVAAGFTHVPMVFLKQFRDVTASTNACFQSVTRATATIGRLRRIFLLTHPLEVSLPPYDSLDIATNLGIGPGPGPTYVPVAGVAADLDFTLPPGVNEWTAP
jgi:hypothetical protein